MKVYYLEDDQDTLNKIKKELVKLGISFFPESNRWGSDLIQAQEYLTAGGADKAEKGRKLGKMFEDYGPDLIVLDLLLRGDEEEYLSLEIFSDVIRKNAKLQNLPVIFLTRTKEDAGLPLGDFAAYVKRADTLNEQNTPVTMQLLVDKMLTFPTLIKFAEQQVTAAASTAKPHKLPFLTWIRLNF